MLFRTIRKAGTYWIEDDAAQMGAALAYYMLFSFAPLLIMAIAVAGLIYGEDAAKGRVVELIGDFIDADSAKAVQTMLENFSHLPANFIPAVIGLVSLVYGSLGVFRQLRWSLHRIWRLTRLPSQGVIREMIKSYLLAFLMVLLTIIFILLLLTSSTFLTVVLHWSGQPRDSEGWTWFLGEFLVSTLLVTVLFAFTFRFMSDGRVRYRHIWGGALVGAVLFTAGKSLIGYYLGRVHLASAYGVAGSLVVFLSWVYYSSQIFFFGAEIVRVRLEKAKPGGPRA
jgi:membrane protein